jgi:hypothetical protein
MCKNFPLIFPIPRFPINVEVFLPPKNGNIEKVPKKNRNDGDNIDRKDNIDSMDNIDSRDNIYSNYKNDIK